MKLLILAILSATQVNSFDMCERACTSIFEVCDEKSPNYDVYYCKTWRRVLVEATCPEDACHQDVYCPEACHRWQIMCSDISLTVETAETETECDILRRVLFPRCGREGECPSKECYFQCSQMEMYCSPNSNKHDHKECDNVVGLVEFYCHEVGCGKYSDRYRCTMECIEAKNGTCNATSELFDKTQCKISAHRIVDICKPDECHSEELCEEICKQTTIFCHSYSTFDEAECDFWERNEDVFCEEECPDPDREL